MSGSCVSHLPRHNYTITIRTIDSEQGGLSAIASGASARPLGTVAVSLVAMRAVSSQPIARLIPPLDCSVRYIPLPTAYIFDNVILLLILDVSFEQTSPVIKRIRYQFGYIAFRATEVCSLAIYVQCIKRCYLCYSQYCVT